MSTVPPVAFDNFGELLERLGNVPPERICLRPPPGQATERDLLLALERDKRRYELVDRTLVEKGMGFNESFLAAEIIAEVRTFARQQDLGIVTGEACPLRLFKGLVRMPAVSFLSWDKLPERLLPRAPIPKLAPDLAVEILSKSNTPEEIERKLGEYFLAGTRLAWVIDPDRRTAAVYLSADAPSATLTEEQSLDGGDVLPGFSLPLAELFARLPGKAKKPRKPRKKKS
jgi:Uma2 family endonuclease